MNIEIPKISCLCITRNKPGLIIRAINCFKEQTYSNKELVIVCEDDDRLSHNVINNIDEHDIKIVNVKNSPDINLGELRNIALENASGKYVCQWDDDDWYHTDRLEYQYSVINNTGFSGCILTKWLVFDSVTQKAYISNTRLWEGSFLCEKKEIRKKKYENQKIGEDTAVIEYLYRNRILYPIANAPNLYIYIYHGKNTWDYGHWKQIFALSRELPASTSNQIIKILNGDYSIVESSLLLNKLLKINRTKL